MATILQLRRGTSTQHSTFTGAPGEVTVDTTKKTIVVHDGTTQGGSPLATEAFVTTSLQAADSLAELSGTSDDITEGSTNLFFTDSRARAAISVTGAGSYNSTTGVIDITGGVTSVNSLTGAVVLDTDDISEGTSNQYFTNARARGAVSVTDNGGDGSLSYNSSTGVFSYTGPSASEVRAHFSAGTGVTVTNGQIAIGQDVATTSKPTFAGATLTADVDVSGDIVPTADNTYSLGSPTNMWKDVYIGPGSLYVNGNKVLEETSGNIVVSADLNQNLVLQTSGSGDVELDPTGNGVVAIKGPMQIQAGSNIASSDGNAIHFSNTVAVDAVTSNTTNGNLVLSGNGTGNVTVDDNLNISGNLTVSGTTTTVNSETISLADNIIDLNSNFTSGSPTENAGLRILRGDEANVQVRWNETTDKWQYTNDGTTYNNIGNVSTLGDLSITASAEELNYVDGVTSNIQTQLDTKFASADFNSSFDTRLSGKSTTNLAEGTNLYFTNTRARAALSGGTGITYDQSTGAISADTTVVATKSYVDTAVAGKDNTDEITEGTTNLYFTTTRARGSLSAGSGISYNSTTGAISADTSTMATKSYVDTAVAGKDNTDEITEGSTNLYFTNARARSALSAGTGISYNSTTGAISSTITQYTDALARSAVSFAAGSGAYNSTTGVFTIPTNTSHLTNGANFIDLTDLSAGTGISYDNTTGVISADTTTVATKTYVDGKISDLVGGASAAYDTLKEIQDAMATDAELSAAIAAITIGNGTQTVTAGSYLTGGGSFTANQTSDSSVTLAVDATSANTASKVVARDASGNFSAGTITAALSGNASTATKWATARTITLGGDLTGNVSIDGSGDVTLTATVAANSVALGTDTTGNYVADVTAGNYITKSGTAGEGWSPTIAVDATSANTASKVVARDASGNFSAGTITATLNGNASTVTNGVYTTDTGTVTNTMLAGSIANAKLVNSSITLAGTSVSLGGSFTAQNMLDAIKTVDGAGSGLDADTLDGQSSAYFRINIYDAAGTLLN